MKKYENFVSNLRTLEKADRQDLENDFVVSGIIDKFSLQFELGWKVMKELLLYEGRTIANTGSPRSIIKAAYSMWDFLDEDVWMEMLAARNNVTHVYDENAARELVEDILTRYIPEFQKMEKNFDQLYPRLLGHV